MSEVLFDVVFKGKFVNTLDKALAIQHFSKLFKLPVEKAKIFFDGSTRTLKKSQTMEKASQFRAALKKAGLRVSLSKVEDTNPKKSEFTLAEPGAILASKPFTQPKVFEDNQLNLDEVGVTIVKYVPVEKKHYDLQKFTVDEVGSTIVDKPKVPKLDLDISSITMEEVGSTFAEKQHIEEPDINIEDLDMEEVGATIVEKKKIPEPKINIDNIKIVD